MQPISLRAIDQIIDRNQHMPGRIDHLLKIKATIIHYRKHGYPKSTIETCDEGRDMLDDARAGE